LALSQKLVFKTSYSLNVVSNGAVWTLPSDFTVISFLLVTSNYWIFSKSGLVTSHFWQRFLKQCHVFLLGLAFLVLFGGRNN